MCNFAWKRRDMAGKPPCAGVGMVGERGIWRVNRHAQVEVVGMVGKIVIM